MKDFVVDIKNLQEQIKKVEVKIMSFLLKKLDKIIIKENHKTLEAAKQQALKEKGAEKKKNRRPASEIQKNHLVNYLFKISDPLTINLFAVSVRILQQILRV